MILFIYFLTNQVLNHWWTISWCVQGTWVPEKGRSLMHPSNAQWAACQVLHKYRGNVNKRHAVFVCRGRLSLFSCSVVSDSVMPWIVAWQVSLFFSISQSLLKLMSSESVMPSNHLIFCCPLLLLPSIYPSIRVFFNESVLCIRWLKYRSFSFNISPSNECSGLIPLGLTCLISLLSKRLWDSLKNWD